MKFSYDIHENSVNRLTKYILKLFLASDEEGDVIVTTSKWLDHGIAT